jgi:hypothetical protein
MVVATATPKRKGPMKWAMAVINNTRRGAIARDEMTVATMFALSWNPLRKSKINARTMTMMMAIGNWRHPVRAYNASLWTFPAPIFRTTPDRYNNGLVV